MAAGFQGHVTIGAPRLLPGRCQGIDFRMGAAGVFVPACTDKPAVPDQYATYPWIWMRGVPPRAGQPYSP